MMRPQTRAAGRAAETGAPTAASPEAGVAAPSAGAPPDPCSRKMAAAATCSQGLTRAPQSQSHSRSPG